MIFIATSGHSGNTPWVEYTVLLSMKVVVEHCSGRLESIKQERMLWHARVSYISKYRYVLSTTWGSGNLTSSIFRHALPRILLRHFNDAVITFIRQEKNSWTVHVWISNWWDVEITSCQSLFCYKTCQVPYSSISLRGVTRTAELYHQQASHIK